MEEHERLPQPCHLGKQVGVLDPFDELSAERELAPADPDLALPILPDSIDIAVDIVEDMRHVRWRTDRGDRGDPVESQLVRRSQYRRAAKAVPDEEDGR